MPQDQPLLKADAIEGLMRPGGHRLNPRAKKEEANLSDTVGMTGLGVHLSRLPPGAESTAMHYHLNVAEWMYITAGSGTLQLLDASGTVLPVTSSIAELRASTQTLQKPDLGKMEEKEIGVGDFIGLRAGPTAPKHAHNIVAGPEGITYLVGGTRDETDICVYPLINTAMMMSMTDMTLLVLNKGDVPP